MQTLHVTLLLCLFSASQQTVPTACRRRRRRFLLSLLLSLLDYRWSSHTTWTRQSSWYSHVSLLGVYSVCRATSHGHYTRYTSA